MLIGRPLISTLVLGLAGAVSPAFPQQLEVTAVRFWTMPEVTRIAIETSGEFHFRSDRLYNPERVFFDLLGAKPRMGVRGVHTVPVGDKLLKRIRIAQTQPGMTRVVLDLESQIEFTASQLSNPDRLMIELRTPAPPAPRAPSAISTSNTNSYPTANPTPPEPIKAVEAAKPASAEPVAAAAVVAPAVLERPVVEEKPPAPPKAATAPKPAPSPAEPGQPPALAAKRTTSGDRTLIRALGLKVNRVVIDPGHGGHDHGSTGRGGLMEKELVLDVAQRLGALIEQRLGSEVIYTRTDDTFIPLENRTALANEKSADLFLSIHANSSPYPGVSGVETYYLNFSSSRDEMDIAARENSGSQKTIHELGDIIQKITKHDKAQESREFAGKMQASLYSAATKYNPSAKNRGVKKAPFVVLIGATMPSILAEIGFVSNSREEVLLKRPEHRQRLAEALFRGLSRYAETLSHFELAAKQ
jgi:N-acetylmuramoyl-L-alanine amidase